MTNILLYVGQSAHNEKVVERRTRPIHEQFKLNVDEAFHHSSCQKGFFIEVWKAQLEAREKLKKKLSMVYACSIGVGHF